MAHFAELDENNKVIRVIVVNNNDCLDQNGNENEQVGITFCKNLLGGNWKQTSYNANFRKNYAGIDFYYDSTRDAFIPPKPFPSWSLNETTCSWDPPTPYPSDNNLYIWDENLLQWTIVYK